MKNVSIVFFMVGFNFAVFAQVNTNSTTNNSTNSSSWKSHTQCEANEKPVSNSNGAFSTTYKTESSSSTQKQGTQNHYNAGTSIGMNRDGERTTNTSNSKTEESHTVKYDCVPANETRKVVPRPTRK